jgi:hypothetical protein
MVARTRTPAHRSTLPGPGSIYLYRISFAHEPLMTVSSQPNPVEVSSDLRQWDQ